MNVLFGSNNVTGALRYVIIYFGYLDCLKLHFFETLYMVGIFSKTLTYSGNIIYYIK